MRTENEPVTAELDVVVRKCCQGQEFEIGCGTWLEHRAEGIIAQMEGMAQGGNPASPGSCWPGRSSVLVEHSGDLGIETLSL